MARSSRKVELECGISCALRNSWKRVPTHDRGHVEVVRVLLSVPGIDIATKNDWGYTPLQSAQAQGNSRVVTLLQEHSQ